MKCFEVNAYTRTWKTNLSSNAFGCFEVPNVFGCFEVTHSKYNFATKKFHVCVWGLNADTKWLILCIWDLPSKPWMLNGSKNTYFWQQNGPDPEALDDFSHIIPRFHIAREWVESCLEVKNCSLRPQSELVKKRSPLLVGGCKFADQELAPLNHRPFIVRILLIRRWSLLLTIFPFLQSHSLHSHKLHNFHNFQNLLAKLRAHWLSKNHTCTTTKETSCSAKIQIALTSAEMTDNSKSIHQIPPTK